MFETHKAFVTFKAHVDQLRLAVEHFINTNKKETAEEWLLELMFLQESFENAKNRKATILSSSSFAHGDKVAHIQTYSPLDAERLKYIKDTIKLLEPKMKEKGWML